MCETYKITATIDSIGEGWSDPAATVNRWNDYIAPVLSDYQDSRSDDQHCYELVGSAAEYAWGEFCGREAGESDEACEHLAAELRAKYL